MAVAIIAIAPELNIDLGYLEVLGLGRNAADKQGGRLGSETTSAEYRIGTEFQSREALQAAVDLRQHRDNAVDL